jgi:hypothetical protein
MLCHAALRRQRLLFAGRSQREESGKVCCGLHAHDEALQLFALILADDIAAERREFYRDFFLRHWIARVALGNIDAGGYT